MLMPKELKKHSFAHALRGYSTADVDEYVEFLVEKYTEVYRENDELERKLTAALRALHESKEREAGILALEKKIRENADSVLRDAEAQKKQIIADAEEFADQLIADADAHVAVQEALFRQMQTEILSFRDQLFARYSTHIDEIEHIASMAQDASFSDSLSAISPQDSVRETPAVESDPDVYDDVMEDDEDLLPEMQEMEIDDDVLPDMPEPETEPEPEPVYDDDLYDDVAPTLSDIFSEEEMESLLPPLSASALDTVPWENGGETEEDDTPPTAEYDDGEAQDSGEDDDALLRDLRQTFHIEYDTIPKRTTDAPRAEMEFLDETDDSEKPRKSGGFLKRFGKGKDGE